MKVTLITSSFGERKSHERAHWLANYYVEQDWTVSLIALCHPDEIPSFTLDQRVQCISLGFGGHSVYRIQRLWKYARLLYGLRHRIRSQTPDVLISFSNISNAFTLLATRGLGLRLVVSQGDSSKILEKALWRRLQRWAYAASEAVVVPTSEIRRTLPPCTQKKTILIPNLEASPFEFAIKLPRKRKPSSAMAVGLIASHAESEKIIRAFALSWQQCPDWRLTIVGDGLWSAELRGLCEQVGIADAVEMQGKIEDIQSLLSNADLLICRSGADDDDNLLRDALAWGVAVLVTEGQRSTCRMIQSWINGVLVRSGNVSQLSEAMELLMSKEKIRECLGSNARRSMEQVYAHNIMDQWESLFMQVTHRDVPIAASG